MPRRERITPTQAGVGRSKKPRTGPGASRPGRRLPTPKRATPIFRKPTLPGVSKGARHLRAATGTKQTAIRVRQDKRRASAILGRKPNSAYERRVGSGIQQQNQEFLRQLDELRHIGEGPAGPGGTAASKNTISRKHALRILTDKTYARGLLAKHYLPEYMGDLTKENRRVPDIFHASVPRAAALVEQRQAKNQASARFTEPSDVTDAALLLTPGGLPKAIGGAGLKAGLLAMGARGAVRTGRTGAAAIRAGLQPAAREAFKMRRLGAALERSAAKDATAATLRTKPLAKRTFLRGVIQARRAGKPLGTATKVVSAGTLAASPLDPRLLQKGAYHVPEVSIPGGGPLHHPLNIGLNIVKDVLNLPAITIPSVYIPARALVQSLTTSDPSHFNAVLSEFAKTDAWAALGGGHVGEFLRRFEAHPLFESLMAAGGYSAFGRAARRAVGLPHGPGSRPGIPTPGGRLGAAREYSPNVFTQLAQRRRDARGFTAKQVRREGQKLVDYGTAAAQVRHMDIRAKVARTIHQIDKTIGTRALAPIVHMVIEHMARPGSFVADLQKLRGMYAGARPGLVGHDELAANAERIAAIDLALKDPARAEAVASKAATLFLEHQTPLEQDLIRNAIIDEERSIRRRAQPEQVVHQGARIASADVLKERKQAILGPLKDEAADAKKAQDKAQREYDRARTRKPLIRRLAGTKSRGRKAEGVPEVLRHRLRQAREDRIAADERVKTVEREAPTKSRMEKPVEAPRVTVDEATRDQSTNWEPGRTQRGVITTDGTVVTWDSAGSATKFGVHADYPIKAQAHGQPDNAADLDISRNGDVFIRAGRTTPDAAQAAAWTKAVEAADSRLKVRGVEEGLSANPVRTEIERTDAGLPLDVGPQTASLGHANDIMAALGREDWATKHAPDNTLLTDVYGNELPSLQESWAAAHPAKTNEVPPLASEAAPPTGPLPVIETGAGYVYGGPKPKYLQGGRQQVTPQTLEGGTYTGTHALAGSTDPGLSRLGYTLLTRGNLLERALNFRDFIKNFARRRADGSGWADRAAADRGRYDLSADELRAMGVDRPEQLRSIRADAADKLGEITERADTALADGHGMDVRDMMQIAHSERGLTEIAQVDAPGDWVLVPEYAVDRILALGEHGKTEHFLSELSRAWKGAILPTSPKWYFGNWFDISMRSFLEGIAPPGASRLDPRFKRGRDLLTGAPRFGPVITRGMLFGETGSYALGTRHLDELTAASEGVSAAIARLRHETPILSDLVNGIARARDAAFYANARFIETAPQVTMIGKVARANVRNTLSSQERAMGGMDAAYADLARGLRETPAQMAYHREVARTFGDWLKLGPRERQLLVGYAPFYMWLRSATRFVFFTLPHHHPIKTAMIAASAKATERQRQILGLDLWHKGADPEGPVEGFLQGGLPLKGGGLKATASISSFGVWSDPGANLVHFILPQVSTVLEGGRGLTWTGNRMTWGDGTAVEGPVALLVGAGLAAESFVPFLPLAHRVSRVRLPGEIPAKGTAGKRLREGLSPPLVPKITIKGRAILGGRSYTPEEVERSRIRRSFSRSITVPTTPDSGGSGGGGYFGGGGGGGYFGGSN